MTVKQSTMYLDCLYGLIVFIFYMWKVFLATKNSIVDVTLNKYLLSTFKYISMNCNITWRMSAQIMREKEIQFRFNCEFKRVKVLTSNGINNKILDLGCVGCRSCI